MRVRTFEAAVIELNVRGVRATRPIRSIICLHGFPEYWAAWRGGHAELWPAIPFTSSRRTSAASTCRPDRRASRPTGCKASGRRHRRACRPSVARTAVRSRRPRLGCLGRLCLCFRPSRAADASHHRQRRASGTASSGRSSTIAAAAHGQPIHQIGCAMPRLPIWLSERRFRRHVRTCSPASPRPAGCARRSTRPIARRGSRPGAMKAMLNWYRASPLIVPRSTRALARRRSSTCRRERLPVAHAASGRSGARRTRRCGPSCLDGLDEFAPT